MTMYVIVWQSLETGFVGRGILGMSEETAKAWCDELNAKHPELRHWYEPA